MRALCAFYLVFMFILGKRTQIIRKNITRRARIYRLERIRQVVIYLGGN